MFMYFVIFKNRKIKKQHLKQPAKHVPLCAKWSSHSNPRGCLRYSFCGLICKFLTILVPVGKLKIWCQSAFMSAGRARSAATSAVRTLLQYVICIYNVTLKNTGSHYKCNCRTGCEIAPGSHFIWGMEVRYLVWYWNGIWHPGFGTHLWPFNTARKVYDECVLSDPTNRPV